MPTLSTDGMRELLAPYWSQPTSLLLDQLSTYLDLLLKWNARTNLTAVREPREMVTRHFGESLVAAQHLPATGTLLDLGSGAGFPGLPLQLALPGLAVTLAESQVKKATFLREAVRTLGLKTEVWGARVETLGVERRFDVVTLRAVDDPELALDLARGRLRPGGLLAHWTVRGGDAGSRGGVVRIPGSAERVVELIRV
jgi:16S rRNA (guanine527-N7)-methyltransferase